MTTRKAQKKEGKQIQKVACPLFSRDKIRFIEKGDVKGEDVYAAMGRSRAGRYLIAFLSERRIIVH